MEVGDLSAINKFFKILELLWHFILRCSVSSKKGLIPPTSEDILLQPAFKLAEKIRTKQIKSETIVRAFVKRIQIVNPFINAVVDERFNCALEDAKAVDALIDSYDEIPDSLSIDKPLLGVPFTTKNSIGVNGLIRDAGVYHKKGFKAEKDSEVVKLMKQAGAIPLLVSNVPEMCICYDSSNTIYGRTNNPYDLTRVPGGSSGGEGALLASAASVIGFGSDIGGSIRIPAYCCGVFGHKTSKFIVSNEGQFPTSFNSELENYNSTGPMCRYAEDLLPMLKILAGENVNKLKLNTNVDVTKLGVFFIDDYSSKGFVSKISPVVKKSVEKVIQYLETICETKPKRINYVVPQDYHNSIYYTKVTEGTNVDLFEKVTGKERREFSLCIEIIKSLFGTSKHTLFILIWLLLRDFVKTWPKTYYERNDRYLTELRQQLDDLLENGVLVVPTQPEPHYYHGEKLFKMANECYTNVFNILGYPSTQCPIGLSDEGMPLGVQVVSKTNNDHLTLAVALELQKAFGGWKMP